MPPVELPVALPVALAAAGTAALLSTVQAAAPFPLLIAERFVRGAGWVEVLLLSAYAAEVSRRLLDHRRQAVTRGRIWLLFSMVFYLQLALGLAGVRQFLMTGTLHVPVPALIVAGPIYRGEGLFMPLLFLATVMLVGPSWCSHLCYFGAWDALGSRAARAPRKTCRWARLLQTTSLLAVAGAAAALRILHVSGTAATAAGIGFGMAGAGVVVLLSRRAGRMVHCTSWCPVGLLATVLGKVSPWRIRVAPSCTECGRCVPACRYNALDMERVRAGAPGGSCTRCTDCVTACPHGAMVVSAYGRLPRHPGTTRAALVVALTILHTVFLAVARV